MTAHIYSQRHDTGRGEGGSTTLFWWVLMSFPLLTSFSLKLFSFWASSSMRFRVRFPKIPFFLLSRRPDRARLIMSCLRFSDVHFRLGDAHGRAPLFRPVITFLPSRHRSKVDRFINRRGIIGLVGFAVTTPLIRAPLDRFRVGLMAEIPARENFKNTKTSKTSQISLGPGEKLLGRAGLVL